MSLPIAGDRDGASDRPGMALRWRRVCLQLLELRLGMRLSRPRALAIAPPHLTSGDSATAADLYAGHFVLAGRSVFAGSGSIFAAEPPNAAWAEELHGFEWLAHFDVVDSEILRRHAVSLVAEWLDLPLAQKRVHALGIGASSRRLINWLAFSPLLLKGSDLAFYRAVTKAMARDAGRLAVFAAHPSAGLARLPAAIATAFHALAAQASPEQMARINAVLSRALDQDILPDGAPVSRNAMAALALAADLIPLRSTYGARGLAPPKALQDALDRLIGFMLLMRHADGSLACFHGVGATPRALIGTILTLADESGIAPESAPQAGFERLAAGAGLVILDTGRLPPPAFSDTAHVSPLAFEFSSAGQRVIVNCGAPPEGYPELRDAVRGLAAHSTIEIDDMSPVRITSAVAIDGRRVRRFERAPDAIPTRRFEDADSLTVAAAHDGYAARYGLRVERTLTLARDGRRLSGIDRLAALSPAARSLNAGSARARFHLHPGVQASLLGDGRSLLLKPDGPSAFVFEAGGRRIDLEESICFGAGRQQRRTVQIVVAFPAEPGETLSWSIAQAEVE